MKNVIIIVLVILLFLFGWLWYSSKSELEAQMSKTSETSTEEVEEDSSTTASTEDEVASTVIITETDTVYVERKVDKPKRPYTKAEKEVMALIGDVHEAWRLVFKEDDPEKLLVNFTPAFTTNEAIIDTKEFAHVDRHNTSNFKEHLEELAATPYEIEFGDTEFLYVFVKDHIFTTSYRTDFKLIDEDGKVLQKSNIISYVSGENVKGKWKVGNYNWIKYDLFDKR